jgi:lipopolysaccharide/colanic/teichoic acid biosynthesis glycosyltransferase
MTVHFDTLKSVDKATFDYDAHARSRNVGLYERFGKRLLDCVLIVVSLVLVFPIMLALTLVLLLQGHSPFFRQDRIGRNGETFTIWKFRTMVPDAERHLSEYLASNPDAAEEWNTTQKLKRDPRVTRIGKFLRKTSLDELPQLWNVLIGDMSLVGPRPMLPEQQALYPGKSYYELKPGITGMWQVSERNDSEFASRAMYDSVYCRDLSFSTDVGILARTISVVLRGTGY